MISLICRIKKQNKTNELIHKTEPQTQKTNLWLPKGKRCRDKLRGWDECTYNTLGKAGNYAQYFVIAYNVK